MREAVTQLKSYASVADLLRPCKAFIDEINEDPEGISGRLWPRFEFDPEVEKLRIPTEQGLGNAILEFEGQIAQVNAALYRQCTANSLNKDDHG